MLTVQLNNYHTIGLLIPRGLPLLPISLLSLLTLIAEPSALVLLTTFLEKAGCIEGQVCGIL